MEDLGTLPLAADFFIFYYCVLSMVTLPVALASFAAAAVGKGGDCAHRPVSLGVTVSAYHALRQSLGSAPSGPSSGSLAGRGTSRIRCSVASSGASQQRSQSCPAG